MNTYTFGTTPVGVKENIFNDNLAYVKYFDFSRANLDNDSRIHAITSIASICYNQPNSINSEVLYNRLAKESKGLPSSSFEFVPVLLTEKEVSDVVEQLNYSEFRKKDNADYFTLTNVDVPIIKFGTWLDLGDAVYLLTNFRAVSDLYAVYNIDIRDRFNTEAECDIIKKEYHVFQFYVDMVTRSQMVRHRINLQELSRRYVSGKKMEFNFYSSEKLKDVFSRFVFTSKEGHTQPIDMNTDTILEVCVNHYYTALGQGVKAQEARRIIPQSAYTQLFMGFTNHSLNNYLKLRDDSHAQWEIRQTAIAIKELLGISDERNSNE